MIQRTDTRESETLSTSTQDGTDSGSWGKWVGSKYYSLEVVQHPLRARMCGFGDRDRRPLAPAAVARMIVRREDNSIVDVNDVDCSFFIVTVDLWSADAQNQNNLVFHPTSVDRFTPSHTPSKTKGRNMAGSTSSRPNGTSGNETPTNRAEDQSTRIYASQPGQGRSDSASHSAEGASYESPAQPAWTYPPGDHNTSFNSRRNGSWSSDSTGPEVYHNWGGNETGYETTHNYSSSDQIVDPALRTPSTATSDTRGSKAPWSQSNSFPSAEGEQNGSYGQGVFQHGSYTPYPQASTVYSANQAITMTNPARQTYTRTLVGPLSANASRLLDEHRKPGIFFLFQDLSVRTEGTFRLRLRLMNVGAPPAPEMGAQRIYSGVSPILAQVFTEPFAVFSAKRFPGVPDTTALSIAFGNQGQKLPLRNRHGASNKPRRRGGGSESEHDSE